TDDERFQIGVGDPVAATPETTLSTYTISGGNINCGGWYSRIGYNWGYGKLAMSGTSQFSTNSRLYLGDTHGHGVLEMSGDAYMYSGGYFHMAPGADCVGELTMSGSAKIETNTTAGTSSVYLGRAGGHAAIQMTDASHLIETSTGTAYLGAGGVGSECAVTLGTAATGDDHTAYMSFGGGMVIGGGSSNPATTDVYSYGDVDLYDHTSITAGGKVTVGLWNYSYGNLNLHDDSAFTINGADLVLGDSNDAGGTYNAGPGGNGTATVSDSSTLTIGNWAVIGQYNQGHGTLEVKDHASVTINGGTRVGWKVGQGTLRLTSPTTAGDPATVSIGSDLFIGQDGDSATAQSKGYLYVNEGTLLTVGDDLLIGEGDNAVGLMEMTGGTVTVGDWFCLARTGPATSGTLNMSGDAAITAGGLVLFGNGYSGTGSSGIATLSDNASFTGNQEIAIAWGGVGTVTVGDGTAPVVGDPGALLHAGSDIMLCNDLDDAVATLNINVGGTVETPYIKTNSGISATVNFDGGLLKALGSDVPEVLDPATPAIPFLSNLALVTNPDYAPTLTLNVMEGGARIDTNGFTDTITEGLVDGDGLDGGLTKLGDGTLILAGTSTYTGDTTVTAGALAVDGSIASDVCVNSGAALLGNGTVTGNVDVATGGSIGPGGSIGTLTVDGDVSLCGTLDIEYNSETKAIDVLNVSGELDLSTATISFSDLGAGTFGCGPYVFATYGTLVGSPAIEVDVPDGLRVDYAYLGNSIALVPEPSMLLLLASLLAFAAIRRRR
ncbi:MAG: autotransporter-associated beta strand repeat-containing protein, partial [Pirellulales bacterium]|nr:autotransporter-associated beta strand repeat-containing protein [Pirellulales bacterium]